MTVSGILIFVILALQMMLSQAGPTDSTPQHS